MILDLLVVFSSYRKALNNSGCHVIQSYNINDINLLDFRNSMNYFIINSRNYIVYHKQQLLAGTRIFLFATTFRSALVLTSRPKQQWVKRPEREVDHSPI